MWVLKLKLDDFFARFGVFVFLNMKKAVSKWARQKFSGLMGPVCTTGWMVYELE